MDKISELAQFIFSNGRNMHDRIDRIIKEIMMAKDNGIQDLTLAQLEVIMAINRQGALSLTELSTQLNVSAPSTSTMVERLVEKKILTRDRSKSDRRKVLINISDETQQSITQIEQTILLLFQKIILTTGIEIGEMWCEVITSIDRALDEMAPSDLFLLKNFN